MYVSPGLWKSNTRQADRVGIPASFELRKLRSQHLCCLHGKEELASEMRKLQSAKRWRLERVQASGLVTDNLPHFQVPPGIC